MPRRRAPGRPRVRLTTPLTDLLRLLRRPAKSLFIKFDAQVPVCVPFPCRIEQHGSLLQEPSPSSIGNACTKKAVGPQAGSKAGCALAGNRTRASRVAGENSTTEPPMPTLRGRGHLRQRWPALLMVLFKLRLFCT
ncbi:hypothetical protein Q7C36_007481 [Tachysurus vachellii]|uniref:Uncharacterized protein n=1 Tax=Tachysurus vachellii TaxID=175792 RepID=A0AA88NA85_TACVA|nr:hypothetical protein Q7C36_007481 [Tachysurus vachellii]